jgi:hypothetical protein
MERRWSKMKRVSEMSVREMGVWKGMLEVRKEELEEKVVLMEDIVRLMSDVRRLEEELEKEECVGMLFEEVEE